VEAAVCKCRHLLDCALLAGAAGDAERTCESAQTGVQRPPRESVSVTASPAWTVSRDCVYIITVD